ncbi:MAG: nucleoside triphosphate pyrophosphohydrolase [Lentisphaeria bacterium]|nr:nucleoside triphosphate pyrophosphohydrolase [Lentisphaeria bacterium]
MKEIDQLDQVMKKLRSPGGCPWDREQTHKSLNDCLLGEVAEYMDAAEDGDDDAMREELGDLLMQVVLNAAIAEERGAFTLKDVAADITEKMIRRHPHVFANAEAETAGDVVKLWEQVKKEEKKDRKSVLDGIPRHVALAQAEKMQKKAAKLGFDWSRQEDILEKIREELDELEKEMKNGNEERIDSESGDLLFAVINFIRFRKRHAEDILARANAKFNRRFRFVEANMQPGDGIDEMEKLWQQVKKYEKEV